MCSRPGGKLTRAPGLYSKCEEELVVIKLDIGAIIGEAIVCNYLLICRCVLMIIKINQPSKTRQFQLHYVTLKPQFLTMV